MQACRTFVKNVQRDRAAHAGLLLARYLPEQDTKGAGGENQGKVRRELQHAACSATLVARPLYETAFERWEASLKYGTPAMPTRTGRFRICGRMIVGLGADNLLETGITLHHTYGVPVVPGSALKGLAAHYCHCVMGSAEKAWRKTGEYHCTLFGDNEDSGHLVFHDAWILPECLVPDQGLVRDVMAAAPRRILWRWRFATH